LKSSIAAGVVAHGGAGHVPASLLMVKLAVGLVDLKTLVEGGDRKMEGEIVSYTCLKEPSWLKLGFNLSC